MHNVSEAVTSVHWSKAAAARVRQTNIWCVTLFGFISLLSQDYFEKSLRARDGSEEWTLRVGNVFFGACQQPVCSGGNVTQQP